MNLKICQKQKVSSVTYMLPSWPYLGMDSYSSKALKYVSLHCAHMAGEPCLEHQYSSLHPRNPPVGQTVWLLCRIPQ